MRRTMIPIVIFGDEDKGKYSVLISLISYDV